MLDFEGEKKILQFLLLEFSIHILENYLQLLLKYCMHVIFINNSSPSILGIKAGNKENIVRDYNVIYIYMYFHLFHWQSELPHEIFNVVRISLALQKNVQGYWAGGR